MSTVEINRAGCPKDERGVWSCLYSGKPFFVQTPRPEEIDIADIAHALSLLCRYGGQCKSFYSVAQHCVHVSELVSPENALWGLLHDASEGLCLCDLPRGVKSLLPDYYRIEEGIMRAVAVRFQLPWPMPKEVKRIDEVMLSTEKEQIMQSTFFWPDLPDPIDLKIESWVPAEAEAKFLQRFEELGGYELGN